MLAVAKSRLQRERQTEKDPHFQKTENQRLRC